MIIAENMLFVLVYVRQDTKRMLLNWLLKIQEILVAFLRGVHKDAKT